MNTGINILAIPLKRSVNCLAVATLLAALLTMGYSATSMAQDPAALSPAEVTGGPYVMTDRLDYQPGDTAIIFGGGFDPFDVLTIKVVHADGAVDHGAGHEPFTVIADADGNYLAEWLVNPDDSLGSLFQLTVDSPNGHHAEMLFTDTFNTYVVNLKLAPNGFGQLMPASGSWNPSHSALSDSYITGAFAGAIHRSFFGFDLSGISGAVVSVELRAVNICTPGRALVWTIYDVSTPLSRLMSNGTNDTPVWNDLGSGIVYASINALNPNAFLQSISFNRDGIAAVQAALGREFVVGGDYGGFSSYPGFDGYLFGCTGRRGITQVQLIITTADHPNNPPVARCRDVTVSTFTNCAAVTLIDDGSFDPDPGDRIILTQTPFWPYPLGTTVVTMTITDRLGASASCTGTVTVVDGTPPMFTRCPTNITVQTTNCAQVVSWPLPTAIDNCALKSLVGTHNPGTLFPVGTTIVTYTAEDMAGNTRTCSFTVRVIENTPPVIAPCPTNIIVQTGPGRTTCDQVATWRIPIFSDNCAIRGRTVSHIPGQTFPVGTTVVRYTLEDMAGNQTACSFTVTVQDTTQPVVTCPPAVVSFGSVPRAAANAQQFAAHGGAISDNCDRNPTVTSSDHVSGACPTIITRTYVVTDMSGNSSTCQQIITVINLFARDGIIWHQPLAHSGASEDTDPSAGGTLKVRIKSGSTIPIQIHAQGCEGNDITANANVAGTVTVFADTDCDGVIDDDAVTIEFNGVGESDGVMDKINGHLKYNLDTRKLPDAASCYILQVTVTDVNTGESRSETLPLQIE